MSIKKHKLVGSDAAGLALAVLLFSGLLQATPITHLTHGQVPASPPSTASDPATAGNVPATTVVSVPRPRAALAATVLPGCTLGSDCYKEVHVPEPESLVMVGTGLLSMAGLIRRRLLRQG